MCVVCVWRVVCVMCVVYVGCEREHVAVTHVCADVVCAAVLWLCWLSCAASTESQSSLWIVRTCIDWYHVLK